MKQELRRQNFNVDPDQAAELEMTRNYLQASTVKDAVLRAARLVNTIARELKPGNRLLVVDSAGGSTRILIPELDRIESPPWMYLCERPHPWRRQFYIKGRKLLASTVWYNMLANGFTPEEAAEDRDLPLEAVLEAIRYCEQNEDLLKMEAAEEENRLRAAGLLTGG